MNKEQVLLEIQRTGLVAVVRASGADDAAHRRGLPGRRGQRPGDHLHRARSPSGVGPAGGALSPWGDAPGRGYRARPGDHTHRPAGGAQFVVSPSLNPETVRLCNRYRVAVMPGAMSVAEVVSCMEAGADIVKNLSRRAVRSPDHQKHPGPPAPGQADAHRRVSLDNAAQWIANGAVALGAGGSLTAGAKDGDYAAVTRTARAFLAAIARARGVGA